MTPKNRRGGFIEHEYDVPRQLWAMEELYRELEIENPDLEENQYYKRLRRSFREFSDPTERTPRISISASLTGSLKTRPGSPVKTIRKSPYRTKVDYIYRMVERRPRVFTDNLSSVFAPSSNPVRISWNNVPYVESGKEGKVIRYYYYPGNSKRVRLWDEGSLRLYPKVDYSYDPQKGTYLVSGATEEPFEVKPFSSDSDGTIIPYHSNIPNPSDYTVNTVSPSGFWAQGKIKQIFFLQYGNNEGFRMLIKDIPETVIPLRAKGKEEWIADAQPRPDTQPEEREVVEQPRAQDISDSIKDLVLILREYSERTGNITDIRTMIKTVYAEYGKALRKWLKQKGEKHTKDSAYDFIEDIIMGVYGNDAR